MAFILAHIGKLGKGIEEFDDQLNIKLKSLKDKVDKKALKKKMKKMKASIGRIFNTQTYKIGKVQDMTVNNYANSNDSCEEDKIEHISDIKTQKHNQSMKIGLEPSTVVDKNTFDGQTYEQIFLQHCIQKYEIYFLIEWSKTINFRIWCSEHYSNIRCQCEYSGYFDNVTIFYENGNIYNGAMYKGKKLIKNE